MQNVTKVVITKKDSNVTVECSGFNAKCNFGRIVAAKPHGIISFKPLQNNGGVKINTTVLWPASQAFIDAKRACNLCPRTIGGLIRVVHTR